MIPARHIAKSRKAFVKRHCTLRTAAAPAAIVRLESGASTTFHTSPSVSVMKRTANP